MNDAQIEAGLVATLEEDVAEALYSRNRANILTTKNEAARQFAYTIVQRLRCAGVSDETIRTALVSK